VRDCLHSDGILPDATLRAERAGRDLRGEFSNVTRSYARKGAVRYLCQGGAVTPEAQ